MTELFDVTHDANNLDEYASTVTDGGDLSTGIPGLAGTTAKMEALIDGTTSIYGTMDAVVGTNQLRFRFYIDPNGLTMAGGDIFTVVNILNAGAPWDALHATMGYDGDDYYIRVYALDDEEDWTQVTADHIITDAEHWVEILLQRESGAGNDDGVLSLWVDGVFKETVETVDNFALWEPRYWRLGAVGLDVGTRDLLYLDEFTANDDGGEIGEANNRNAWDGAKMRKGVG